MKRRLSAAILIALFCTLSMAQEKRNFNSGWLFTLGDASSKLADHTHNTEYFNYRTKIQANNQSVSPAWKGFDDSSWQKVTLPHDWVVELPFSGEASHSHGYKCVGWKYPQNSVGWYRKHFTVPASSEGKHLTVEFEGIFRDSEVYCNGVLLGYEQSGYASSVYDITDAVDYGSDNVLTVRVDASLEEGWFYEGAGIYRNVWMRESDPLCLEPYSVLFEAVVGDDAHIVTSAELCNYSHALRGAAVKVLLEDAEGQVVASVESYAKDIKPMVKATLWADLTVKDPILWDLDNPYLYTLKYVVGTDTSSTRVGIRTAEFTHDDGFLLNDKRVQMRGCDLHLDHAGVGVAVPDELWRYKLETLKKYGFNTIRCSHNPASPAMLDLCDELGFLVIDENRLMGSNQMFYDLLERMIKRDRCHPSVVLWSVGNEEWAIEWKQRGTPIAEKLTDVAHNIDPTRPTVYASSSGQFPNWGCDVFGYNYIVQNPVMEQFVQYPNPALGTEETTGCGTRGKYETVAEEGWMVPLNRTGVAVDERYSPDSLGVVERGWRFYNSHPQFAGLCYWTGFDYRGESNPMVWPATGSQFGLLDYCGFPKDEAFYLKANWTDEPMVHICGPYNGEIWVYSNCERVKVLANGRNLGTKRVSRDGHLVWKVKEGSTILAIGYKKGYPNVTDLYPEIAPEQPEITLSKEVLKADGQDVVVVDVVSWEEELPVTLENAHVLGWGNGNPGFKETNERPSANPDSLVVKTFSGRVQLIIVSDSSDQKQARINIGTSTAVIDLR